MAVYALNSYASRSVSSSRSLSFAGVVTSSGVASGTISSTSSSATPSGTPYQALGCYTDHHADRTLHSASTNSDSMSVEYCANFCSRYLYFGVEYKTQCYCGDSIASTGVLALSSNCNTPCQGDSSEICGGSWRLNMYEFGAGSATSTIFSTSQLSSIPIASSGLVTSSLSSAGIASSQSGNAGPTSTASGQPSQSSAPVILPEVSTPAGMYMEQGCYVDSSGDGYPLVGPISFASTTVAQCIDDCAPTINGAYAYAGLEGTMCYCSNEFDTNAVNDTSACTQACPGDSAHICGGGIDSGKRSGGGIVIYLVRFLSTTRASTDKALAFF
jgi:hypothetical protein